MRPACRALLAGLPLCGLSLLHWLLLPHWLLLLLLLPLWLLLPLACA